MVVLNFSATKAFAVPPALIVGGKRVLAFSSTGLAATTVAAPGVGVWRWPSF